MDAKAIQAYREAYYKALCEQSKGHALNMDRAAVEAEFRHVAFETPDKDIEALAAYGTPEQMAAEELM
jgi:hypothetical protein